MLNINCKFLSKIVEMCKNGGNSDKNYSGNQALINSTLKLTADDYKVKFDTINIGKDYFSGLSISVDNATGESMSEVYLNLEKFLAILDTFDAGKNVTINTDEKSNIIISDGKRKGRCPTLSVADMIPILPSMPASSSKHTMPACILKEMLGKVKHAIAPKEVRQVLRGVNLSINQRDEITLACADGKRLAIDKSEMIINGKFEVYQKDEKEIIKEEVNVIIPERTMIKLLKLLEGKVEIRTQTETSPSGIEFTFSGENYEIIIYSSLITGKFPNFNQVFPNGYDSKIEVNKKEITGVLKGHKRFTDKLYRLEGDRQEDNFETVLKIDNNILNIISGHTDHGILEDSLEVNVEEICFMTKKITINTRYLLEGIQEVYGDKIVIQLDGEFSPVVVSGKNGYKSVIMPIKPKNNR